MKMYKIGQLCDINPKTSINLELDKEVSFVPMNAVSVDCKIDTSRSIALDSIKNYTIFKNGDILFAKITPCMENGKGCIADKLKNGYGAGSTEFIVLRPKRELVTQKWLHFFLSQKSFRLHCQQHMTGSAGQKRVPTKFLANCDVPCPSLSEQERIVSLIEELFSQLDASVAELKTAKERLKVYRQAVLKEAFGTNNTTVVEISKIVDDIHIGPFGTMLHKDDYISGGIPVINPQHIKKSMIVPGATVTVSIAKANELNSYKLKNNDIIMGRRGEMGRCAAVTGKEDGWLCGTGSILFRLKPDFDAVFYAQILSSPDVVHYLEENATGTTMKNLNEDIVKNIPVPYITRQQQMLIAQKIDAALSVCDSIEETVDTTLQQAEALRQSILKKAFEGRL